MDTAIKSLPPSNYLVLVKLNYPKPLKPGVHAWDSKLLSVIAYVRYGGNLHKVILDTP